MTQWHRTKKADIALRLAGALVCALAYVAFSRVVAWQRPVTDRSVHWLSLGVGLIGFLAASAGGALLLLGRHLLDEVEVSARWRTSGDASSRIVKL